MVQLNPTSLINRNGKLIKLMEVRRRSKLQFSAENLCGIINNNKVYAWIQRNREKSKNRTRRGGRMEGRERKRRKTAEGVRCNYGTQAEQVQN